MQWRFRRLDGEVFVLAVLWSAWVAKDSREAHQSYTMLTLNSDTQDKPMLVIQEAEDWNRWIETKPGQ